MVSEEKSSDRPRRKAKRFRQRSRKQTDARFKKLTTVQTCSICKRKVPSRHRAQNRLTYSTATTFFPELLGEFDLTESLDLCARDALRFRNFERSLGRPIIPHDRFADALQEYRNERGVLKTLPGQSNKCWSTTYGALLAPGMRKLFSSIPENFETASKRNVQFLDIGHGDGSIALYATLVRGFKAVGFENVPKYVAESKKLCRDVYATLTRTFTDTQLEAVERPTLKLLDFVHEQSKAGTIVKESQIIFANNKVFGEINVHLAKLLAKYARPGTYIAVTDPLVDSRGNTFYSCLKGKIVTVEENIIFDEESVSWSANSENETRLHIYRRV